MPAASQCFIEQAPHCRLLLLGVRIRTLSARHWIRLLRRQHNPQYSWQCRMIPAAGQEVVSAENISDNSSAEYSVDESSVDGCGAEVFSSLRNRPSDRQKLFPP